MKRLVLFGLLATATPGCQNAKVSEQPHQTTPPKVDRRVNSSDAREASVKELERHYKLAPMRVNSTDDVTVYRARNDSQDTLIGVGTNGEVLEGADLINATDRPIYVARLALGVFVSPMQSPLYENGDGYLGLTEPPRKVGGVYEFHAHVDDVWMRYTWNPATEKLTSEDLTQTLRARHEKETTGEIICARKAAYCGCWTSQLCFRADKLDPEVYPGDATHRRLAMRVGDIRAYVSCDSHACAHGDCYECAGPPAPCTASCKETPAPYYCAVNTQGICEAVPTSEAK